ncbi:DinB family protein [Paraglaciecola aquimarina]|uniref:DinB family protein n=1 Tax=Paraglaciecola aquimarina TaxID=1235557 RepID=A0ABU3SYE4_9ALTE|nr:DinB family protein [Paraglaciecola aquimarina]MDU0355029.1 DinB family protein [Paraglaciecola aquimarina]
MNEILKARAPTTDLDLRNSVRREPGYEPKDRLSLEATESSIVDRFCARRHYSLALINTLSAEDMQLQSMPDTSPTKWHLAHTTWFFEQFILVSYINNYQSPQPQFNYLFNSYYEQKGQRHPRSQRGMLSRPSLEQVLAYREQINKGICDLLQKPELLANESRLELMALVELGMHHEMQHQELMLTDILHCLSQNPLYPAVFSAKSASGQGKELVDSGSNQFSFHPEWAAGVWCKTTIGLLF